MTRAVDRFRRWRARRAVERIRIRLAHAGVCVCDLTDEQVVAGGQRLIAERYFAPHKANGTLSPVHFHAAVEIGEQTWDDYRIAERGLG